MSQQKPQWLFYAIASGACAAMNGVFAKLTTTKLTTTWASIISRYLGQSEASAAVELLVRVAFFLLNLAFNGVMWGLFTRALTLGTSTVRVSVINTSANFMLTALLGAFVFNEDLPTQWWIGASLLVAGSVIIGRREAAETGLDQESDETRVTAGNPSRPGAVTDQSLDGKRQDANDSGKGRGDYDLRQRAKMSNSDRSFGQ